MVRFSRGSFDGSGVMRTWKRTEQPSEQCPHVVLLSNTMTRNVVLRARQRSAREWIVDEMPKKMSKQDRFRVKAFLSSLKERGVQVEWWVANA